MEDVLMPILIVIGAVLIFIPSQKFKNYRKFHALPRKTYWSYILMWLVGAGLMAAGFLIGGI